MMNKLNLLNFFKFIEIFNNYHSIKISFLFEFLNLHNVSTIHLYC